MPQTRENGNVAVSIPSITNGEFLRALAADDWERVPISWGENSWWVRPAGKHIGKPRIESSNYFTVSIFALAAEGSFRRVKELFQRQFVFVIDDVGTKLVEDEVRATLPPPTYILETSPRNYQWGFKLTDGTDARALDALVAAIVDDPDINPSLKDPGMKGVTRPVRLPVGSNNKDSVKAKNGGKGWPHVLHVWEPSRAYTVETLAFWLGVDLGEETLAKHASATGSSRKATTADIAGDVFMRLFEARDMVIDATPNDNGFVSIVCPWANEHSDSRNEAGYRPGSGGFQCHHGHCESRTMEDVRQWAAEECADGLERAQTDLLREVFEAAPIDWDAIARIATSTEEAAKTGTKSETGAGFTFDGDAPVEAPRMLVKGIIPFDGVAFVGGQSGAGKTFVAIDLGVALASGEAFFGHKVCERVGVVILAAEGGGTIANRVAVARNAKALGEILPIAWTANVPDLSRAKELPALIRNLRAIGARFKESHGVRLGAVIVDTLAAAFGLEDENNNSEAARAIRQMHAIAAALGAVVIPVHHYGKGEETGLRGASAWRAGADAVLSVTADRNQTTGKVSNRRLSLAKTRSGEEGELSPFELRFVELGRDEDLEPFGACYVEPTPGVGRAKGAGAPKASRAARVYLTALEAVLRDRGAMARPFGAAGPEVFAADREDARREFYERWPADGDNEAKRAASKQKAFRRGEAELSDAGAIGTRESGAATIVWLDRDTGQGPDMGSPL